MAGEQEPGDSTRERLLVAAAALFAERGREGVTIRDIAATAGVRHGCINYHFRSKDELYHEVTGPVLHSRPPTSLPPRARAAEELTPAEARERCSARSCAAFVAEQRSASSRPGRRRGFSTREISQLGGAEPELLFERVIQPNQQRQIARLARHGCSPNLTGERELRRRGVQRGLPVHLPARRAVGGACGSSVFRRVRRRPDRARGSSASSTTSLARSRRTDRRRRPESVKLRSLDHPRRCSTVTPSLVSASADRRGRTRWRPT